MSNTRENVKRIIIEIKVTDQDALVVASEKDRYKIHADVAMWLAGGKKRRVLHRHWDMATEILETIDPVLRQYNLTILEKGGETNG